MRVCVKKEREREREREREKNEEKVINGEGKKKRN